MSGKVVETLLSFQSAPARLIFRLPFDIPCSIECGDFATISYEMNFRVSNEKWTQAVQVMAFPKPSFALHVSESESLTSCLCFQQGSVDISIDEPFNTFAAGEQCDF